MSKVQKISFPVMLVSYAVIVSTIFLSSGFGASAISIENRFRFEDNEKNLIGMEELQGVEPESQQSAITITFPGESNNNNSISSSTLSADSDQNQIITAGTTETEVTEKSVRQGRTLHHIAKKVHFVEAGVQSAIYKFLSLLFPRNHSPDYVDYAYRKDGNAPAVVQPPKLLKRLVNIPQYLTSHPINFKKLLPNLNHVISKRSIADNEPEEAEAQIPNNDNQGRTLHKLIPNFETNFNTLFRKVFPTFADQTKAQYQSNFINDGEVKSSSPTPYNYNRQNNPFVFTNLMTVLPHIFNRRYSFNDATLNNDQQPQDIISLGLRRVLSMLRRPILSNSRNQFS